MNDNRTHISLQDVQDIIQQDDRFDLLFEQIPSVEHVRTLLAELNTGNQSHAEKNLASQQEMDTLRHQITEMADLLDSARANLIHLHEHAHVLTRKFSHGALVQELERRRETHAQRSHDTIRAFYEDNEMDVTQFIQNYKQERTQFHLNAMYVERLVVKDA